MRCLLPVVIAGLLLTACSSGSKTLDIDQPFQDLGQIAFVDAVMRSRYLYHDQLPALDPADFDSPEAMLEALRINPPDRWSYLTTAASFDRFYDASQYIGFGFRSRLVDERMRLAGVHAGSPMGRTGATRGDEILAINGTPIRDLLADEEAYEAAIGPEEIGFQATFSLLVDGETREVVLAKELVDIDAVPQTAMLDAAGTAVGYIVLDDFIDSARRQFEQAAIDFATAGVRTMIVDLRYNGGGSLSVAAYIASLLHKPAASAFASAGLFAATTQASDEVFCRVSYNDTDWTPDRLYRFASLSNSLELDRILFLTGGGTASASEVLINGLRPFHELVLVGQTTHGKPVGGNLFVHDASGLALIPITFATTNALGEGGFFDGIAVDFAADDDLDHQLGDPSEGRLAAALHFIQHDSFPSRPAALPGAGGESGRELLPPGWYREIGRL